jgi:hypothetical protein
MSPLLLRLPTPRSAAVIRALGSRASVVVGPALRSTPRLSALVADVSVSPSLTDLPGSALLQRLADGISAWALLLALIGLLVGAAVWALGAHSQNYQQAYTGRRAVLVCGLAALLIGAAPAIINFFFHAGEALR